MTTQSSWPALFKIPNKKESAKKYSSKALLTKSPLNDYVTFPMMYVLTASQLMGECHTTNLNLSTVR